MHEAGRRFIAEPDDAAIRAALGRIVASPALNRSPQLVQFLAYVVEESLAGRGDRIKAYSVATDAFGRCDNFDPQHDPIVRVEAARLRHALQQYYAADGRTDRIVIDLPPGKYVPVFHINDRWRRSIAGAADLWWKAGGLLRANYRLLLMVAGVTTLVSLAFDVMGMLLFAGIAQPG